LIDDEFMAGFCKAPAGVRNHHAYIGGLLEHVVSLLDAADKIAALHARTLLIAQIETVEGLDNVEAIAAVPGIDVLWLGHFDLTNSMGIPGAFDHPDYVAAVARIVRACDGAGKAAGFLATDERSARDAVARGFRMIAYGVDQLLLQDALRTGLTVLREATNPGDGHDG